MILYEILDAFIYSTKLQEIFYHYGLYRQIDKTAEELGELTQAIMKYKHCDDNPHLRKNVISEIADVQIMLAHLEYGLEAADEVKAEIKRKIGRQIKRIEKEHEQEQSE